MKENLHSRDTEGVSPQVCAARSKHLYFSASFVFEALGKPCTHRAFLPTSSKPLLMQYRAQKEEPKHVIILFLVSGNIPGEIPFRRTANHFAACLRFHSHEWAPQPGVWLSHPQACTQKETTITALTLACHRDLSKPKCCLLSSIGSSVIRRPQVIGKCAQMVSRGSELAHCPLAVLTATPGS